VPKIFGLTPGPKQSRRSQETVNYLAVEPLRKATYGARNVSKSLGRLTPRCAYLDDTESLIIKPGFSRDDFWTSVGCSIDAKAD